MLCPITVYAPVEFKWNALSMPMPPAGIKARVTGENFEVRHQQHGCEHGYVETFCRWGDEKKAAVFGLYLIPYHKGEADYEVLGNDPMLDEDPLPEHRREFLKEIWTKTREYADGPPKKQARTITKDHSEPGPNDKCLCGSGLKFKRCCGAR